MTAAEAWFWFYIIPMVGAIGLIGYLWCKSVESNPWPGSED